MTALQAFCNIIRTELALENDQVYLYNQKFNIPPDERLYIAVGVQSPKVVANRRTYESTIGGLNESQEANCIAELHLVIMSRSTAALDRKEEVVMALQSTYALQMMQKYGFGIGRIPRSFVNLSEVEGAAIPFRFDIVVSLNYSISKTQAITYYDDFSTDPVVTDP